MAAATTGGDEVRERIAPSTQHMPQKSPHEAPLVSGAALNCIYTMWRRDLLRYIRDRSRIIASLGQPILFLFVFGAGLSHAISSVGSTGNNQAGLTYVQFMFPGIIAMAVLFTSISSAISVVWDREFGFLKEVLVAPAPRWAVATGKALGGSTTAVFQGIVLLILAPLVGIRLTPLAVALLLPTMFLLAFALSMLGLFIAAQLKTLESFQMVMNFLLMPLFFLSGALFPLANLPGWLAVLTHIDPVSYGVDAIRRIVLTQSGVPQNVVNQLGITLFGFSLNVVVDVAFIVAFAAIMTACAVMAFSRQE